MNKTLFSLSAIVCLFVASQVHATVIGVTVNAIGSNTVVGNTAVRPLLGSTPAVEYFIPLTENPPSPTCVYGVSCGVAADGGTGGTIMSMYMMFNPVSITSPSLLEIVFEDLDLIGVNDPYHFLETVEVFNSLGTSLTGQITNITSSLVTGNHDTQQLLSLGLGVLGSTPLWLKLEFSASYPYDGWNTPEYLIASVSSVPEPATMSLLGVGLLGLGFLRRRRAQSPT